MALDVVQLILWAVFGLIMTWGLFLSYVGFKSVPNYSKRTLAKSAANFVFVVAVVWIALWVSAVVWNAIEIIGAK